MKHAWLGLALGAGIGCSDPEAARTPAGNQAADAAVGGSLGVGAASGGVSQAGGSQATGGQTGGSTNGGGSSQASGGTPSGGTPASGGAPGAGGALSGGARSGAGGASGDLAIAAGLSARIEVPCKTPADGELCSSDMTLPPIEMTLAGDPLRTYTITLRFRGLVEPHTFVDASQNRVPTVTPAPYFFRGRDGMPEAIPYALYTLETAAPPQRYYANAFHSIDNEFHHQLFAIDYTADITAKGGSTVKLIYADGNDEQVANFKDVVVPGVLPAPATFNGQFLQIDVVAVAVAP